MVVGNHGADGIRDRLHGKLAVQVVLHIPSEISLHAIPWLCHYSHNKVEEVAVTQLNNP